MTDKQILLDTLTDVVGEGGCCVACTGEEIFEDEEGWKMFLDGFMEPWFLGKTVEQARQQIREYATMGFGLK